MAGINRGKGPVKKLNPVKMIRGPEQQPVRAFRPGVIGVIAVALIGLAIGYRRMSRPDRTLKQPDLPPVESTIPPAQVLPGVQASEPAPPPPRRAAPEPPPAPPAPATPSPQQGTNVVPAAQVLNQAVVDAAFASVQSEVTACHSLYFRGTVTTGSITVRVDIDGPTLGAATIEQSGLPSTLFNECVARAASHAPLPTLQAGSRASLRYTYTFRTQ